MVKKDRTLNILIVASMIGLGLITLFVSGSVLIVAGFVMAFAVIITLFVNLVNYLVKL